WPPRGSPGSIPSVAAAVPALARPFQSRSWSWACRWEVSGWPSRLDRRVDELAEVAHDGGLLRVGHRNVERSTGIAKVDGDVKVIPVGRAQRLTEPDGEATEPARRIDPRLGRIHVLADPVGLEELVELFAVGLGKTAFGLGATDVHAVVRCRRTAD